MNEPSYDVIIFDLDGTLCDTQEAVISCLQQTFEQIYPDSQHVTRDQLEAVIASGSTLPQAIAALSEPSLTCREKEQRVSLYRSLYHTVGLEHTLLYPGVRATLDQLVAMDISLAVMSNKGVDAVHRTLAHLHIEDAFRLVVAETAGVSCKPSPDSFNKIIKPRFPDFAARRFLMVGDTEADIGFANNAALSSCWVAYGYGLSDSCLRLSPDHQISSIDQLIGLCRPG